MRFQIEGVFITTKELRTPKSHKEKLYIAINMKQFFLQTNKQNRAAFIARLTLAIILFPHGAQKLLGWYGGYGFTNTMAFFTDVKHLPYIIGLLVILIEFFGAIALLFGFATRLWSALIIAVMVGIIFSSHVEYGFFINWGGSQQGEGFEYHLLVIGLALSLVFSGGGRLSLDSYLLRRTGELR